MKQAMLIGAGYQVPAPAMSLQDFIAKVRCWLDQKDELFTKLYDEEGEIVTHLQALMAGVYTIGFFLSIFVVLALFYKVVDLICAAL